MKKRHRGIVLPITNWEAGQWEIPVQRKPINPVEGLGIIKLTRFALKLERVDDSVRHNEQTLNPIRRRIVQRIMQRLVRKQLVLQIANAGEAR